MHFCLQTGLSWFKTTKIMICVHSTLIETFRREASSKSEWCRSWSSIWLFTRWKTASTLLNKIQSETACLNVQCCCILANGQISSQGKLSLYLYQRCRLHACRVLGRISIRKSSIISLSTYQTLWKSRCNNTCSLFCMKKMSNIEELIIQNQILLGVTLQIKIKQ